MTKHYTTLDGHPLVAKTSRLEAPDRTGKLYMYR
jgi:hypothetical protein